VSTPPPRPARPRKTGRRPGDSGSRDAILAAARAQFGAQGFRHTTVRAVATAAGVDPALVMHFFGSKDGLFAAALALPPDFPERLLRSLSQTGGTAAEGLVSTYLTMWESPETGAPLLAMYRSASTNEHAARMLREFLEAKVMGQVASLGAVDRETLVLVASQLVGAAATRHIFRIEPVASMDLGRLIARLTVSVQALLDSAQG
jgi:AcrR family transcriptional regulator